MQDSVRILPAMVPEAELEQTEAGLVPASTGWFVMNAREQEDFLVLSGEALLIVKGQERALKQWDFVHCPPETRHVFVGAGNGACVILAASSRQFQKHGPWDYYTVDETARRYDACPDVEAQDGNIAYANVPPSHPARYREGSLPD